jgi:hypothetical protein
MVAIAVNRGVWGFVIAGGVQIICGVFNPAALIAAPAIMGFLGLCDGLRPAGGDRTSKVVVIERIKE